MTGLWYWVWWCAFCTLLVVVGGYMAGVYRSSGRVLWHCVPLLLVLLVLVAYFPLTALGGIH